MKKILSIAAVIAGAWLLWRWFTRPEIVGPQGSIQTSNTQLRRGIESLTASKIAAKVKATFGPDGSAYSRDFSPATLGAIIDRRPAEFLPSAYR
jgi:hypothetical protein